MVRAVLNSVLDVIRQLLNGVGFTTVSDCLSSLINKWLVLFWFYFTQLPQPRTDYVGKSFSYSGAALWNSLPTDIRVSKTLGEFKNEAK